jgi:RHS repeat-associated protein
MRLALLRFRTSVVVLVLAALVLLGTLIVLPRSSGAQGTDSGGQESAGVRAVLSGLDGADEPIVESGGSGQAGSMPVAGTLVQGMSTAMSDTYRTARGPLETRVYTSPINYRDAEGQWSGIESELVADPDGYRNGANSFELSLPQSLAGPVSLSSPGGTFSFSLVGADLGATAVVSGDTATYTEALSSTDVAFTSQANGVSDALTLKDQSAPSSLSYDLSTSPGMSVQESAEGGLQVLDSAGVQRFAVRSAVAYRQDDPADTQTLPVSLSPSGSGWVLRVDTSAAWLREALASGPVVVDPWTEVTEPSQTCTLTSGTPTTSSCNQTTVKAGYATSSSSASRALLEFNLSAVPAGANVLNSALGLYLSSETSTAATSVGAYRVSRQWTPGATWEKYDGTHAWTKAGGDYSEGQDGVVKTSVGGATGWVYWEPTKAVQEWVNGAGAPNSQGDANYGTLLKDVSEGPTNNVMSFSGTGAKQPILAVLWEPQGIGVEAGAEIQYQPLTDKMQLGVNMASGDLLVQSHDLHVAGRGVDFDSSRTWNSLLGSEALPEGHQYGSWADSNDVTLGPLEEDGSVLFSSPTGHWYRFQKQGSGYIEPSGLNATLCTTGSAAPCPEKLPAGITYRLIFNQSQIRYDFNSHGIIDDVQDRYGNELASNAGTGESYPTQWTDTEGRKFAYGSYEKHWIASIKDESGAREVTYGYSKPEKEKVLLETYKDAAGNTTHYSYTGENLTEIKTPKGNEIKLAYDSQRRIREIVRVTNTETGTGPTTTYTYYAVGSAPAPCASTEKGTVELDPDGYEGKAGHTTTYCSNVLGQVDKRVDANGNEASVSYNAQGNVSSTTAAAPGTGESGGVESLNYDESGRNLMCVIQGTSTSEATCPSSRSKTALVTSFSYLDANNAFTPTQVKNPEGNSTYDCYNKSEMEYASKEEEELHKCPAESSSEPAGVLQNKNDQLASEHELKFTYNSNGSIKTSTDARGHKTEYAYDEKGNLKEIKAPASSGIEPTKITVDADSRPHVVTDGAGHIETITYDKDDRITKIEYTGTGTARTVSFEYDADGNIKKREDTTGTTKYTVDDLNRVTKEELPGSLTNEYGYDAASNLTSFTDGGGTTKYAYNGLNELESMTEPSAAKSTTFAYDNDGHLTKITYPSGAKETYKLEPATGRPETITAEGVTGTTVPKLTYAYKEGEYNTPLIQSLTESTSNTTNYIYDQLNRLTEAKTSGTGTHQSLYKYTLDGAGNRTKQVVNATKDEETGAEKTYFVPNNGNELLCRQSFASSSECSGNATTELSHYSYDAAGEQTAITPKSDTSGAAFEYNAASELAKLTPSGSEALSLSYGGTGQDDLTAIGAATSLQNGLPGITREVNSVGTSYFARTPNGLLIDERTPSGNYNPLYDAQGDIIALVSSTGKVERTFHYGPYGENIKSEGTQTIPYPFGFKGGYRMPAGNTGKGNVANSLIHYGVRYYDPTTGRWTQQDPEDHLGSTTQGDRFLFAGSDPINLSDPTGFSEASEFYAYAGGGSGIVAFGCGVAGVATGGAGFVGCGIGAGAVSAAIGISAIAEEIF